MFYSEDKTRSSYTYFSRSTSHTEWW